MSEHRRAISAYVEYRQIADTLRAMVPPAEGDAIEAEFDRLRIETPMSTDEAYRYLAEHIALGKWLEHR